MKLNLQFCLIQANFILSLGYLGHFMNVYAYVMYAYIYVCIKYIHNSPYVHVCVGGLHLSNAYVPVCFMNALCICAKCRNVGLRMHIFICTYIRYICLIVYRYICVYVCNVLHCVVLFLTILKSASIRRIKICGERKMSNY